MEHAGTNMDVLVINNFLLFKGEQPNSQLVEEEQYLARFELD